MSSEPSLCSSVTVNHHVERIHNGESETNEKGKFDPYLVQFDESDPLNPKNWTHLKRWYLTLASCLLILDATFASSAPSGIVPQLMEEFDLSQEVGVLTISLFVGGYCIGPLLWGPLSEQFGRRPIFISAFFAYTCFQLAVALSTNAASILIFRFLGGTFAAAPLANSGALVSDIWDAQMRGKALSILTVAPFAGPAIAPIVSGYIIVGGLSWRWLFWILTISTGICWLLVIFAIPETYRPILLVQKAQRKRKETGDARFFAPLEKETFTILQQVKHVLALPFKILFHEPMLIAITVYMSFVYGCVYLLFEAYPIVFTKGHHFNPGVSGLMFVPIPVGGAIAVIGYIFIFNPRYEKEAARCAPRAVPPEFRLEMALYASPLFTISFFWFAWTSYPSISFWVPMMAGLLMGLSISLIFMSLFNYIIDAYLSVAASALAATIVIRSLSAAVFPMFATQMYKAMGPQWASSLLGFIALTLMPIPFVLIKYGPSLRMKSKYAPTKIIPTSLHSPSEPSLA